MRLDGRANDELRPIKITPDFIKYAEGSVLIEVGNTKVICTASIEDKVPQFLKDKGKGWITAEYSMLPRSTAVRSIREAATGKMGGRTHEIQRLIGRSLRSAVNLDAIGERTVWIDCDVILADGGTRTAAISGAYVALALALKRLKEQQHLAIPVLLGFVAAVSVGMVENETLLDLNFSEDSTADTDMNVIMTDSGHLIEIQGTAERTPFSQNQMLELVKLAQSGIERIIELQKNILGFAVPF
ncbi:MAG: ribonuclease PH [Candidatus Schekmanbacteria bacterium]|nr:ribonuclease PH [Candidatus Schekmanbacteria bacterium]